MQQTSESLIRELDRLKASYSRLKQSSAAGEQVRGPRSFGVDSPDFKKDLAALGSRVIEAGKKLSLPLELPVATIEDLDRSLQLIAMIEDQHSQTSNNPSALAVLDRVLLVARRDGAAFQPLLVCQAQARKLRDDIVSGRGTGLAAAIAELCDGSHVLSMFLDLIERQDELSDDQCLRMQEVVAMSFGSDLAVAAIRGKLLVQSSSSASVLKQPTLVASRDVGMQRSASAESDSSTTTLKPAGAKQKTDLASGSAPPLTEDEIEQILANIGPAGRQPIPFPAVPSPNAGSAPPKNGGSSRSSAAVKSEPPTEITRPSGDPSPSLSTATTDVAARAKSAEGPLPYPSPKAPISASGAATEKVGDRRQPAAAMQAGGTASRSGISQPIEPEEAQPWEPMLNPDLGIPVPAALMKPAAEKTIRNWLPLLAIVAVVIAVLGYVVMRYASLGSKTSSIQPAGEHAVSSSPVPTPAVPLATLTANQAPQQQTMAANAPSQPVPKQEQTPASSQVQNAASASANSKPAASPAVRLQPVLVAVPQQQASAAPKPASMKKELPAPPAPSSVSGTSRSLDNAPTGLVAAVAPLPAPPDASPASQPPVRVASTVIAARLISGPRPAYPPLAKKARIQGTVRLQAVISKQGAVEGLAVVSGHQLLTGAAMDAVRKWRYQPTVVNGAPVEVITTVDVDFVLEH